MTEYKFTRWYDCETGIIIAEYPTPWTLDDHYQIVDEGKQMMRESNLPRVDMITVLETLAPRGTSFTHFSNVLNKPEPNLGLILLVVANPIFSRLIDITTLLTPTTRKHYRSVVSVEASLELIHASRSEGQPV